MSLFIGSDGKILCSGSPDSSGVLTVAPTISSAGTVGSLILADGGLEVAPVIASSGLVTLSGAGSLLVAPTIVSSGTAPAVEPALDDLFWYVDPDAPDSGTYNLTTEFTVGNNTNRLLICVINMYVQFPDADQAVTACSWNGNSFGAAKIYDEQVVHGSDSEFTWWFDMTGSDVTVGTHTLSFTYTGTSPNVKTVSVWVGSYYNMPDAVAADYQHVNTGTDTPTTISDTITPTDDGSLVIVQSRGMNIGFSFTGHDATLTEVEEQTAVQFECAWSHDLSADAGALNYTETRDGARRMNTLSAAYSPF